MVIAEFEEGTITLRGDLPPNETPPGCEWDDRTEQWRGKAYRYRQVVTWLRSLEIEHEDRAAGFSQLSLVHRIERTPHQHQEEALTAWKASGRQGIVVLPTGTGKSYLAELAMVETPRSTLVVAPTIDLMNQWYDQLSAAFGLEIGLIGGGYHEPRDITVTTYDSAYIRMDRLGDRFGLVVFDEVHHLPGPTYMLGAECCVAPYRLGLTATLERADGRHELLDEVVGQVVYERSISELAGTHLAQYEVVRTVTELSAEEQTRYEAARQEYVSFIRSSGIRMGAPDGWSRFVAMSCRSPQGRRAMRGRQEMRRLALAAPSKLEHLDKLLRQHAADRVLIFTNDNETVYRISRLFLVPAITHQTDAKERREILERFNSGRYPVVVTSKVLNEGVNVPAANIAIVLSGSGSVREHVQRLGRILRRHGDKHAVLYEVVTLGTVEERVSRKRREHEAYRTSS